MNKLIVIFLFVFFLTSCAGSNHMNNTQQTNTNSYENSASSNFDDIDPNIKNEIKNNNSNTINNILGD